MGEATERRDSVGLEDEGGLVGLATERGLEVEGSVGLATEIGLEAGGLMGLAPGAGND